MMMYSPQGGKRYDTMDLSNSWSFWSRPIGFWNRHITKKTEWCTGEDREKFNQLMDKIFINKEKEIHDGKTKKFSRDNDIQQKRVYKWKQRCVPGRTNRSSSMSSVSSQGESNASFTQSMVTRYNNKGKKKGEHKSGSNKRKQEVSNPPDNN